MLPSRIELQEHGYIYTLEHPHTCPSIPIQPHLLVCVCVCVCVCSRARESATVTFTHFQTSGFTFPNQRDISKVSTIAQFAFGRRDLRELVYSSGLVRPTRTATVGLTSTVAGRSEDISIDDDGPVKTAYSCRTSRQPATQTIPPSERCECHLDIKWHIAGASLCPRRGRHCERRCRGQPQPMDQPYR